MDIGWLKKLEIIGYKDGTFNTLSGHRFRLMINPKDYESKKEIKYCVENWIGGPVFKSYNQEGLELEFVLDTTGVLTKLGDDKFGKSLKSLINDLSETVYQYIGTVHQPGFVKVIWGELNFQGRLQQMDIKYTMFDPNGAPLRATVQLKLIRYTDVKTFRLQMSNSSPDLSHVVTVKDGDTLPDLCRKIYDNTAYCTEVARINGLTGFRYIEPGTQLLFPPLTNE
ncbi:MULTISPECIES: hypothetical protein [Bacteroides]|uniref:CIS tube protein n=1 Tax=Bacteroides TaxID=816 RepID=UPI00164A970C|nr:MULTISPECIES: hypothetical protein [Bacteroides]MBC5612077.1 hypothetical protein [Bacteroides hominis (ex Liu et al. 2022)]MCS2832484.1 hypothetical protein [Bacteroides fragilis]MCY6345142.1 hypothetical protein [Bacteroides fragilis]MCZ2672907.1 hypothetical protein [Bacteroides fragilis]MDV6203659.1 hypothetical protein [Bacteroides hominis (ex Liu et al. 2022)]